MSLAPPSWMLVRLALETKAHHAGADADRLALLDVDPTVERYRTFLEAVYTFESRYEHALIQAPVDPRVVRGRMKAARLREDLLVLGATEPELAAWTRPVIPAFRSEAEALGWMYVVERNTLLHGLLRRHLAAALPRVIERAGSYLAAYGDAPGTKYRDLGGDLEAAARRAIPSQLVEAAHAAFACQRLWFAHVHIAVKQRPAA